ncbi:MAG: hypothetical protein PF517_04225 [Salinivirgaceae bacterium]|jgi:hypothetical protein|nr:hypothetical protein [Salinivirgaceae bacterium]
MGKIVIHDEECRVIKGFERYCISESGRVYRHIPLNLVEKAIIDDGALYVRESQWHYRHLSKRKGQPFCSLTNSDGKLILKSVAPYVAEAFEIEGGIFDHKEHSVEFVDGNSRNLHYTNLRITGKKKNNAKLIKADVKQIKDLIKKNYPLKHIAIIYGVSDMQINRIKTGENWGNGKRKIKAPTAPFQIQDGKIRRYIATFNQETALPEIKKPFSIKRNPKDPTDNLIIGILKGYKLSLKHKNITRAQVNVKKLNDYFFGI